VTEIQQNRYDQLMRRVVDAKGPGSMVNDALTELFPMLDVENLPAELQLLSGTRIAFAGEELAPGVGNIAKIQLFNPAGSGQLVIVDVVQLATGTSTAINMTLTAITFPTAPGIELVRDTRLGVSQGTTAALQTDVGVGTVAQSLVFRAIANTTVTIGGSGSVAVLAPGTGLLLGTASSNVTLDVNFFWRERVAQASELNF